MTAETVLGKITMEMNLCAFLTKPENKHVVLQ